GTRGATGGGRAAMRVSRLCMRARPLGRIVAEGSPGLPALLRPRAEAPIKTTVGRHSDAADVALGHASSVAGPDPPGRRGRGRRVQPWLPAGADPDRADGGHRAVGRTLGDALPGGPAA